MQGDGIARDGLKTGDLVVVTGGGGGFGRAFSRRFAREGAKVAVWDVDTETGEETAREWAPGNNTKSVGLAGRQNLELNRALDEIVQALLTHQAEKVAPPLDSPGQQGGINHEKFERDDGVIRPREDVDPDMTIYARTGENFA